MMSRTVRAAWTAVFLVALTACAGGAGPGAPQRYDLGRAPVDDAAARQPQRTPLVLAVSATALAADSAMIWRVQDSPAPQSYAQARWAAAPTQLVRQRLVDRLAPGGPVLAASVQGADQLLITLTAFEQVFSADGQRSEGQLALRAVLLRDNAVLGSTHIQAAAPASSQDAAGGAAALRDATAQAADQLAAWLDTLPPSTASRR